MFYGHNCTETMAEDEHVVAAKHPLLFYNCLNLPYKRDRVYIPALGVKYRVYKLALGHLIKKWLYKEIGDGQPTSSIYRSMIASVNDYDNLDVSCSDNELIPLTEPEKFVYYQLIEVGVLAHLRRATNFKRMLWDFTCLLGRSGTKLTLNQQNLILYQDLSKYTHREALGFALLFGDNEKEIRQDLDIDAATEAHMAMENNHWTNPYNPNYHGRFTEMAFPRAEKRAFHPVEDFSVEDLLVASTVDMLVSHGKELASKKRSYTMLDVFDVKCWYLNRYHPTDKAYVKKLISDWKERMLKFLSIHPKDCVDFAE